MISMRQNTALFAALLMLLAACGGGGTTAEPTPEAMVTEARTRIRAQEDSLFNKMVFDRRGALELRSVYIAYAERFPTDTLVPEYLFRAASVSRSLGEPQESLKLYDRVIKNFPSWSKIADAYYLRAFTIDSDLGRKGEAKTAYEEVIQRFPDHKFAADAKQMIENLQYTDEELIERFKRMNAAGEKPGTAAR